MIGNSAGGTANINSTDFKVGDTVAFFDQNVSFSTPGLWDCPDHRDRFDEPDDHAQPGRYGRCYRHQWHQLVRSRCCRRLCDPEQHVQRLASLRQHDQGRRWSGLEQYLYGQGAHPITVHDEPSYPPGFSSSNLIISGNSINDCGLTVPSRAVPPGRRCLPGQHQHLRGSSGYRRLQRRNHDAGRNRRHKHPDP